MPTFRKKIERGFESFTRKIYRNRFKTIFIMLVVIAGFVSGLPKVTMDTSMEGFLHENDPIIVNYNKFREQFGRDEIIVLAIKPPNVFDLKFLEKLKKLHIELEDNVPHLDDITSLVNIRNTRGEGNQLIVEDLLEKSPQNEAELAALKKRILDSHLYKNLVVSEDGKFTTVIIRTDAYSSVGVKEDVMGGFEDEEPTAAATEDREYLTDAENSEAVGAVREIADKYHAADFDISIGGSPVLTNDLRRSMQSNMRRFMVMAIGAVGILLFILFRRVSGVFMPMLVVILSLLSTVGLMGHTGVSIKLPTQILPSFLLAVGVGASVHVLAIFYRHFAHNGDKEAAIVHALGHSGLAIVMTSLTTAAGLGSFATAEVAPIADLGRFASSGILISLIYTIVLLPALIAVTRISHRHTEEEKSRQAVMDRILTAIADFSVDSPWKVTIGSFTLIFAALALASFVKFSHNPLYWFPEDSGIRKATQLIDTNMRGANTVEVVIDTKKENGLYEPALLNKIEALSADLMKIQREEMFVGKTNSIVDMTKEINKALNENREEFYKLPQTRELAAQELLLFENSGSDDLEDMVDSQFSKARMVVKVPWLDAYLYGHFLVELEQKVNDQFKGEADVALTGMMPMLARTLAAAMTSSAKSYIIAMFVITIMMIILVGDVKIGLISMIPNVTPIIIILGVMGAFGMPLDMFTMLIGSIAIGLAVDDTVHFMHNFRKYHHDYGDVRQAVRDTLLTTGRAMLVTTIVLSTGFFIYMFSEMSNLFNFGLLTGITIAMALMADFLLAPALMAIIYKHGAPAVAEEAS